MICLELNRKIKMSRPNFSQMSNDTLRHARGYGWIYLTDQQLYDYIQEMFPTFSIERMNDLHNTLVNNMATLTSDQRLVFNALDDASEYEIYAEGSDVTIVSPDELDLPYPYLEIIPGTYSLELDNINDVIALLEISNVLKFKVTNRNSFSSMLKEGKERLPFNESLYKSKFSKKISLNHVYEYATRIKKHQAKDIKHVKFNRHDGTIKVDNKPPIRGDRKDYENICLSMSQLL